MAGEASLCQATTRFAAVLARKADLERQAKVLRRKCGHQGRRLQDALGWDGKNGWGSYYKGLLSASAHE